MAQCDADASPNTQRICAPCHAECVGGCDAPADAMSCRACRHNRDDGWCVPQCPATKTFVDGIDCAVVCPTARPYYNDTRMNSINVSLPSACVARCRDLNDTQRMFLSVSSPYRCTTEAQASKDTPEPATDNKTNSFPIIIVAVVLGLVILLIVIVLIARTTRRRGAQGITSPQLTGHRGHAENRESTFSEDEFGGAPRRSSRPASVYSLGDFGLPEFVPTTHDEEDEPAHTTKL